VHNIVNCEKTSLYFLEKWLNIVATNEGEFTVSYYSFNCHKYSRFGI